MTCHHLQHSEWKDQDDYTKTLREDFCEWGGDNCAELKFNGKCRWQIEGLEPMPSHKVDAIHCKGCGATVSRDAAKGWFNSGWTAAESDKVCPECWKRREAWLAGEGELENWF